MRSIGKRRNNEKRRGDADEDTDAESYLWQLQNNFIRMTDQECHLPEAGLEKQAQVMFAALAKVGALEVLEDG